MAVQQIFVKPLNGARVRKENGEVLAAEGETVERSAFWLRRIKDGDVEIVAPAKSKKSTSKE
jgi:hypothetical protein